ncbi:MAG: hypothetical protein GC129_07370 [Proteobacteria bacterium]|nr:hypothetical protein [Pseudomonadota bacterium]
MTYHILYESTPWHTRCALFDENGRLLTLRHDDATRRHIEGAVVWGRVRAVEKSLGAAFVDIGDTHDGILPFSMLAPGAKLTQGQPILVRIDRGGFAEKGARLDARTAHKLPDAATRCPSIIHTPPPALTRALHDAASHPVTVWLTNAHHRDAVSRHIPERALRQLDHDEADWVERLDTTLDAALSARPTFYFGGNGGAGGRNSLIVELTSAVATIDVNAAPITGLSKADATLAVNLAAAEEVARLCRLLDLGGSVIIDFITPRSKAHRQLITDHLSATLQTTDDKFVEIRPMSRHGLLELTRARTGPSLTLLLKLPAYVAGRIGLELWRTPAGANPSLRRQTVIAHPSVIACLQPHLTNATCLAHLGRPITLQAEGALPLTSYRIEG